MYKLPLTSNFILTSLTKVTNGLNYPHKHIKMYIMSFITHTHTHKKNTQEFKEQSKNSSNSHPTKSRKPAVAMLKIRNPNRFSFKSSYKLTIHATIQEKKNL